MTEIAKHRRTTRSVVKRIVTAYRAHDVAALESIITEANRDRPSRRALFSEALYSNVTLFLLLFIGFACIVIYVAFDNFEVWVVSACYAFIAIGFTGHTLMAFLQGRSLTHVGVTGLCAAAAFYWWREPEATFAFLYALDVTLDALSR